MASAIYLPLKTIKQKMKKRFLILSAAAICSFAFSSCSNDDSNNSLVDARVRTYIEDYTNVIGGSSDTLDVTYDASNRISMVALRNGNQSMNYTYSGSSTSIMTMMEGATQTLWVKNMANSMNLVDSTIQSEMPGDSLTEKYIYNSNHQVIETRSYNRMGGFSIPEETVRFEYDSRGNKIREIGLNPGGDTTYVMTSAYNNSTPNWYTVGMQFMPVMQKNQPVSEIYYYPSTGDTETTTIEYQMDNLNRITKETRTNAYGTSSKSYIYF